MARSKDRANRQIIRAVHFDGIRLSGCLENPAKLLRTLLPARKTIYGAEHHQPMGTAQRERYRSLYHQSTNTSITESFISASPFFCFPHKTYIYMSIFTIILHSEQSFKPSLRKISTKKNTRLYFSKLIKILYLFRFLSLTRARFPFNMIKTLLYKKKGHRYGNR